jgi:hypothetical protein
MRASGLLVAISFFAPAAFAAAPDTPEPVDPPAKKTPPPEPKKELPPYIASARRSLGMAGVSHAYADGPLTYDVEIVNPTTTALETTLVVERLDGAANATVARVPVKVGATDRASVSFIDSAGLKDGCNATRLRLALENGTSTRTLKTTPSCTFATETSPGDASSAARRGRLHYHSASLATPSPTCGAPFTVKATVRNEAAASVDNAKLRLDGPNVDGSTSFDLAAGGKEKVLTVSIASWSGIPGSYALKIDTPATVPVFQGTWSARATRSCRLEIELER